MKTIGMKTKKTVNQKLKRIFLSLLLPAAMTASVTCNAQNNSGIPPHQMRVASYNIQHGMGMDNQLNYKRIAEVLRAISPDVVALQEVDSMTQRTNNTYALGEIAEQLNYYASYAPAIDFEGGKYGIGILSRERPISVRQYALPGSEEARTLLVAEFAPMAMIFVPSKGGISHDPAEYTSIEDIALGTDVLANSLLKLANMSKI